MAGFLWSKWIGCRSENLSCPIQINSGVLSGTQECSHKRSFFSLINPLFKRTGVIWSMLLPPNTSLKIRVCFREQEVTMNQQVSDIWRMPTPLLFPVWAFWCWEPDQALKNRGPSARFSLLWAKNYEIKLTKTILKLTTTWQYDIVLPQCGENISAIYKVGTILAWHYFTNYTFAVNVPTVFQKCQQKTTVIQLLMTGS